MADPAHDATPDPVAYLENVITTLRDGARDPAGLHLDPELCAGLAEGLGDVLDGLEMYAALADAVRTELAPPPPPRLTRLESRSLARRAVPLDPERRVLAFPVAVRAPAYGGGGSAA